MKRSPQLSWFWRSFYVAGKLYRYLANDHMLLEELLQRATGRPREEKILLPAAERLRGGEPFHCPQLAGSGAVAALVVLLL